LSTFARLLLLYCLGALTNAGAATLQWRFTDAPGEGFNDLTLIPADQRGNNPGTTFGEARQNLVMEAGRIWGGLLTSNVPIIVEAAFNPQTCDATSGTLASAGARTFFRAFSSNPAISPETFFASALADSLAGVDLMQDPDVPPERRNDPDIRATFNVSVDVTSVGGDPNCLNGAGFYYGFNNQKGTRIDLLVVALHELAHGFGFSSEIDTDTGIGFTDGRFSSFVEKIFDETLNSPWPMLTPAQRMASAVGNLGLAWNGMNVNSLFTPVSPGVTGQTRLRLFAPSPVSEGSSVSHWDRSALPNLLMEPNISRDLTRAVDVTVCALKDIGWRTTRCPDNGLTIGAPPMANSQSVTVTEDTSATITLTATDTDGDQLTYNVTSMPARGVVTGGTSASRIYTPNTNATGTDSFTFAASDGSGTSAGTVTITINGVNDPPTANVLSFPVTSGQSIPITLSGMDVDGDTLTFELVSNPTKGTLTGSGAALTYQSNTSATGTDSFMYRVRDASTVSSPAVVTINVSPRSTPVPGGRGGGGGAMNELLLLVLAALALAARVGKSKLAPRRGPG